MQKFYCEEWSVERGVSDAAILSSQPSIIIHYRVCTLHHHYLSCWRQYHAAYVAQLFFLIFQRNMNMNMNMMIEMQCILWYPTSLQTPLILSLKFHTFLYFCHHHWKYKRLLCLLALLLFIAIITTNALNYSLSFT